MSEINTSEITLDEIALYDDGFVYPVMYVEYHLGRNENQLVHLDEREQFERGGDKRLEIIKVIGEPRHLRFNPDEYPSILDMHDGGGFPLLGGKRQSSILASLYVRHVDFELLVSKLETMIADYKANYDSHFAFSIGESGWSDWYRSRGIIESCVQYFEIQISKK